MGNGVWTVEIIPAEIQPPPREPPGASGNRIRIGSGPVTNWGDATDLVVAFNEQVLLGRHRLGALAEDAIVLIENRGPTHDDERHPPQWAEAMEELARTGYRIIEVPMEEECLQVVDDAARGRTCSRWGCSPASTSATWS
jgi:2-oxoglutarate/2-oxoacid ferredoxin oxidoreductase subunit alpha